MKELKKLYGNLAALDGLNLSIPAGVIYGLLGPNGAGKTTAVRILCATLNLSSGEVLIFGNPPGKKTSQIIGYMPQDLALYLDLTVMDNINLYGQLYGLDSKTLKERSANLLNLMGLAERKSALLSELSGGMKRKVSLVCALVHNPRLLILDEPTVGVDPTLRATLWNYFQIVKEAGSTIILTTHYMDEAMHCDKVGFILDGKLIAEGTPDDILQSTETSSLENAFLKLSAKEEVAKP